MRNQGCKCSGMDCAQVENRAVEQFPQMSMPYVTLEVIVLK